MTAELLALVLRQITHDRDQEKLKEEYHLFGSRDHRCSTAKGDAAKAERIRLESLIERLRAVEGMC